MRLIDADTLMAKVMETGWQLSVFTDGIYVDVKAFLEIINNLPTIEERKTGKWERHNTYHGDDTSGFVDPDWRCSECGEQANVNVWSLYDLTNFCPNCGARMEDAYSIYI